MLCRRCTNRIISSQTYSRAFSTTLLNLRPENPPAATTSAAQPFSTPLTPSPSETPNLPTRSADKASKAPRSSVPAGTLLRGLNYIKGADPIVARDDNSYPPWLWTLLDPSSKDRSSNALGGDGQGDAYAKSKKQRRIAAKAARAKTLNPHASVHTVKIPLHEQSIDLPSGGREATVARDQLGVSMREARRKKIKEQNFLKGMR